MTTTDELGPVRYDDPRGSLEVLRVDERTSIFVAKGHLTPVLADAMATEGLRIAQAGRAVALHDWSAVTGYDTETRQRSTAFMLEHRRSFDHVVIYLSSALVAMGVNVANIGLGGFLHATADRAEFDVWVRRWRGDGA